MKPPSEQKLRELDYYLAEHVMGWKRGRKWANGNGEWIINGLGYEHHHISVYQTPHYTTDPTAAMMVLKACMDDPEMQGMIPPITKTGSVYTWSNPVKHEPYHSAPTLEFAICEFAKQLKSK